ncbi:hypothetical protein [Mitsuaria sp. 7]|uniref:hypothetical protein n=1 Tax=Mitsuaria sp. 7 TaxID=1658665 RepID=UPI0018D4A1D6|nr:hypothetical protein [Mitsuaria sp. 7]
MGAKPIGKWNFHERQKNGKGVISTWVEKSNFSPKSEARMDRAIDQLRQLPKTSWHKPHPASGIGDHIFVIRFTDVTNAQKRIFGHFNDSHECFVMTLDGYEKDDVYVPSNYKALALEHRGECEKDFFVNTRKYGNLCPLCEEQRNSSVARH